jgi:TolB protein
MRIPGAIDGLAWSGETLPAVLPGEYRQPASITPTPLWIPFISPVPGMPGGRQQVVALKDVEAPYPMLDDMVNESFQALRTQVALSAGWDMLATLENAYIPLTSSLDPGMEGDWLYTGRAFAFTPLPVNAGWIVVTREDFGQDTYWRAYVKALSQDGSAGMPLHTRPWDFSARYAGDPHAYEQGGALAASIPPGYWLDFTQIAAAYGWQRLPALLTWRSAYQEARFNEFVLTDGMSWDKAMLEIYPPEVLITPTPFVPPTRTPTPTPRWYQSPTPTATATFRPTWTPYTPEAAAPTETSTPVPSPTPTSTSAPAAAPSSSPTRAP